MGLPNVVTFSVKVTEEKFKKITERWLTPERTWTEDRQECVEFQRYKVPTARQSIAIDAACQDIIGGFKKWLELITAETDLWEILVQQYQAQIWPPAPTPPGVPRGPSTRPVPESEVEAAAHWQLIEDAWYNDRSPMAAGLREMRKMASRIRFMAQWQVLIIGAPKGWESVADLPDDPPGLLELLMLSYQLAVAEQEKTQGN